MPAHWWKTIVEESKQTNTNPYLVAAVCWYESNQKWTAGKRINGSKYIAPGGINICFHGKLGNLFDVNDNLRIAVRSLRRGRASSDSGVLRIYNKDPNRYRREQYIRAVLGLKRKLEYQSGM